MSFFSKRKSAVTYASIQDEKPLMEDSLKAAVSFSNDVTSLHVREYTSPSIDGSYLVISEDEHSVVSDNTSQPSSQLSTGPQSPASVIESDSGLDISTRITNDLEKGRVRLECRSCTSDLPVRMKSASAVMFGDEFCVGGGYTGSADTDCRVYTYNSPFDLWGHMDLPTPCKWFGMAVFQGKLVLVGGRQVGKGVADCWNKLTVWDAGKWSSDGVFPAMSTSRITPTVFTHGSSLVVAGGRKGQLDYNVEILNGDTLQWSLSTHLPLKCSPLTSLVSRGNWYLLQTERAPRLLCNQLRDEQDSGSDSLLREASWCELPTPPMRPIRVVALDSLLLVLTDATFNGNLTVYAFSPAQSSWIRVGKIPMVCGAATTTVTPQGELLFIGGDAGNYEYSNRVYKVSLTTSAPQKKRAKIVAAVVTT